MIYTYLYQKKCDGNIILEAESRNIGSVALPGKFYEKMRISKYIFVEADIQTREINIANEYIGNRLTNFGNSEEIKARIDSALSIKPVGDGAFFDNLKHHILCSHI